MFIKNIVFFGGHLKHEKAKASNYRSKNRRKREGYVVRKKLDTPSDVARCLDRLNKVLRLLGVIELDDDPCLPGLVVFNLQDCELCVCVLPHFFLDLLLGQVFFC